MLLGISEKKVFGKNFEIKNIIGRLRNLLVDFDKKGMVDFNK